MRSRLLELPRRANAWIETFGMIVALISQKVWLPRLASGRARGWAVFPLARDPPRDNPVYGVLMLGGSELITGAGLIA